MRKRTTRPAVTSLDYLMSRRAAVRTITTAGIAMGVFLAIGRATTAHPAQAFSVSVNTNLRTVPSGNAPVITVIPKGATFRLTNQERNGFYRVDFNGKSGWVFGPLITAAQFSDDASMVGEAYAAGTSNLRSGPGTGYTVLRTVASGATLNVSNTVQNGFRYVVHEGTAGWISDQLIAWRTAPSTGSASTLTTTASLNLRAGPGMTAKILAIMPAGSRVTSLGAEEHGFRKISYQGTVGWAAMSYLD